VTVARESYHVSVSGFRFNPGRAELCSDNAIVSGRNTRYVVSPMEGSLSLKTILCGSGVWSTPAGRYEVSPDTCLVLNDGQTYELEIDSPSIVHTFCVFFKPGFVSEAAESVNGFGFYERLQLMPSNLSAPLERLRRLAKWGDNDSLEADEAMVEMALALVTSEAAPREESRLELSKASSRQEVFRNLNRSRDFALSCLDSRLTLDGLASVAAMSPFHFHRLHRQAFGETPHEFVTGARIARAMRLLRAGNEVGDVSLSLGFESVPTFTRLFKGKTGMTPGAFRKIG
jgi:AraC family transcriptional regulator